MEIMKPLLFLAFIICAFLAWFFSHRARHKERLLMIERGLKDTEHSEIQQNFVSNKSYQFPWLKVGIVMVGLSIGLLIISILKSQNLLNKGGNALPLSVLGICGGVALIIANFVNPRKGN